MEQTDIIPEILPPASDSVEVEGVEELTEEEEASRHRLELKVERALVQAAVALL